MKTVIITGAASGIGLGLAKFYARKKARVIMVDRNQPQLAAAAAATGENCETHCLDVTDRIGVIAFADSISASGTEADIVINNAGVELCGPVEDCSFSDMEWLININLWGVINMSKAFIPLLTKRPRSSLVNVSSVFGLAGVGEQAAYCASKFAVRGFTESLRQELWNSGVRVTAVYPCGIRTNLFYNARSSEDRHAPGVLGKASDLYSSVSVDDAARRIARGIAKGKPRIFVGTGSRSIDLLARYLPNLSARIMYRRVTREFRCALERFSDC